MLVSIEFKLTIFLQKKLFNFSKVLKFILQNINKTFVTEYI